MFNPIPTISDRRIRVAIIGCGRISTNHIRSIAQHHDKAHLVAICDVSQDALDTTENLIEQIQADSTQFCPNLSSYLSYNEFLKSVRSNQIDVDLVVLTTPSGLHPIQTILAAQCGLHVCTEKPMATRWADGLAMVKECDAAGVHLFVVKQNRFNTTLQLVKKQIEKGRFGRLSMVSVNVFWQRPQSYYDQSSWRGTWEFDGGALMNQASHYIDLLDWLIGPVQSLSASTATLGRDIEAEDTASIQLRWRNGALGTMAVTMLTYPKNLEGSITILGTQGSVRIGGPAVNKIEHWSFSDHDSDDRLVEQASYETTSVYGFGHPLYYENMLRALQGTEAALCPGREGLRSLELLVGAYRSARDSVFTHFPIDS